MRSATRVMLWLITASLMIAAAAILAGCGGGGDDEDPQAAQPTVPNKPCVDVRAHGDCTANADKP